MKKKTLILTIVVFFSALTNAAIGAVAIKDQTGQQVMPVVSQQLKQQTPQKQIEGAINQFEKHISFFEEGKDLQAYKEALNRSITSYGLTDVNNSKIILAMATQDMDDDIRLIMAEIKATNEAKQKLREKIKSLNHWISEQMEKAPKANDINNETVSSQSDSEVTIKVTQSVFTPNYNAKYYEAPKINALPSKTILSLGQLKRLVKVNEDNLHAIDQMEKSMEQQLEILKSKQRKLKTLLSTYN